MCSSKYIFNIIFLICSSKKYFLIISSKKFLHLFNKHVPPFLILHYEAVKVLDESIFIELIPLTVPPVYIPYVFPYIVEVF